MVWNIYRTYLGVNHIPDIIWCGTNIGHSLVWTTYRTCFSNSNLKLPRGMFGVDHIPDIFWCGPPTGYFCPHQTKHAYRTFLPNQNLPRGMFGVEHIPDIVAQPKLATWHGWCETHPGHFWCGPYTGHYLPWHGWCGTQPGHFLVWNTYRTLLPNQNLPCGMVGVEHIPDIFWCGPYTGHYLPGVEHIPDIVTQPKLATWHV